VRLLTTKDEGISAAQIRDRIHQLNPIARAVVFETSGDLNWAASASRNAKGKMIFDWLRSTWGAE
jgi:hypothetical protein